MNPSQALKQKIEAMGKESAAEIVNGAFLKNYDEEGTINFLRENEVLAFQRLGEKLGPLVEDFVFAAEHYAKYLEQKQGLTNTALHKALTNYRKFIGG